MTGPTKDTVTIDRRFVGPPDSANGGYACGLTARALAGGPAEVTLRNPPPVDRPLHIVRDADLGRAALYDGDRLIAEGRAVGPDEPAGNLPAPVSFADAVHAAEGFDVARYAATHPFPGCFGCGPDRDPGDGLGIIPAPAGPRHIVCPWVPDPWLTGEDGLLDTSLIWTALDCVSGLAWYHDTPPATPAVLGRMTAAIHRRPAAGEQLLLTGWAIDEQGRKRLAGSAVQTSDGEVLARNTATWIVLADRHHTTYRPTGYRPRPTGDDQQ